MIELNDKLSGRYHLLELIGQGGMANVYLARDLILDRDVAVKVLRFDFQDDQDAIRRFQREAMSASQLLHHNIVEVYDVDEEDDQQYIVMEYVDGQDLKSFIRDKSPLSLEMVVSLMGQILSGIDVAHKNGLIHRDIKPQNILLTSKNEVKITDFGIAVALTDTSITQTNTLLGSVHYLSPEQAKGGIASLKSDIYSLGVVLYELITGSVPYNGESAVSIALKHFQEDFPLIRDQIDYVPQSLENVVLKATAKNPDDRYQSVQAMLRDLSTSLSANRSHEAKFEPPSEKEEVNILRPIKTVSHKPQQDQTADSLESSEDDYYDNMAPLNRPRRRMRWLGILLIIILTIAGLVAGYYFISQSRRFVSIPDMEDVHIDQVQALLQENDLILGQTKQEWNDSTQVGYIIASNPKSGSRVERGSQVDVSVSLGKQQVSVPDAQGMTYEQIRKQLTNAEFIVDRKGIATNDPSQDGIVIGQSIEPGTRVVPSQTPITLYVATYSENASMQDFVGLSFTMVENFADEYGLYINTEYAYSDYIPVDHVIDQEPASGTQFNPGDEITVTLSMGPEEEEIVPIRIEIPVEYVPRYSENDVNQLNPLPNEITIFINDTSYNINQPAQQLSITESEVIEIVLEIPSDGVGQYRVMNDGEIVAESNQVFPY